MTAVIRQADIVTSFRLIIAPNACQAKLFIRRSGFYPGECQIATKVSDLHGYDLRAGWEVWWLDRMWPCRTREQVANMLKVRAYARARGADIHHWWT